MIDADPAALPAPRLPTRVDAHQHFWEIESGAYSWPTPADGPIYRTFTPDDLEPDLTAAAMDATVLVQTVDTLQETDSMLATAERYGFVRGVVGWVPLDDAPAAEAALDARPDQRLRGMRHLIHHEPDPSWLVRASVGEGLRLLADRGLTFDVVAVFPDHLSLVPTVADRYPDLVLVIDHLAKPPFRSEGWARWSDDLRAAAERPNVAAKLSGLDTAAGPDWTDAEVRPAIDVALDAFGPTRLMFGSDWPVCRQVSRYVDVVRGVESAIAELSTSDRAAIMGGTAIRIYGLTSP
jgi:L-fuconolactonase